MYFVCVCAYVCVCVCVCLCVCVPLDLRGFNSLLLWKLQCTEQDEKSEECVQFFVYIKHSSGGGLKSLVRPPCLQFLMSVNDKVSFLTLETVCIMYPHVHVPLKQ